MASERRTGAGSRLSGVLESTPREEAEPVPTPADEQAEADAGRGRGSGARKASAVAARPAKKVPGRTVYIPDDLWERVIVQAHRRRRTISEYVVSVLDRQVPDHRVIRNGEGPAEGAA